MDEKAARRRKILEDLDYAEGWPIELLTEQTYDLTTPHGSRELSDRIGAEKERRTLERFPGNPDAAREILRGRGGRDDFDGEFHMEGPEDRAPKFDRFNGPMPEGDLLEMAQMRMGGRSPAMEPGVGGGTGSGIFDNISSSVDSERLRLINWLEEQDDEPERGPSSDRAYAEAGMGGGSPVGGAAGLGLAGIAAALGGPSELDPELVRRYENMSAEELDQEPDSLERDYVLERKGAFAWGSKRKVGVVPENFYNNATLPKKEKK